MTTHRRWYSIQQAADYLGLDRVTVRRLVQKKTLRAISIPGETWRRIPLADLQSLKASMDRELIASGTLTKVG